MSGRGEKTVVLVRHAESKADPEIPAARWTLTPRGVEQARALGARLAGRSPAHCLSSPEPKALQTAAALAGPRGLDVREVSGLREHERADVPFYPSREDFVRRVTELFERPDEVVFGSESAAAALRRFSRALSGAVESREGTILAVTHGTVMSLFLEPCLGRRGPEIWAELGWCGFAALAWPAGELLEWDPGA